MHMCVDHYLLDLSRRFFAVICQNRRHEMIFRSILQIKDYLRKKQYEGFTVGFIPTMGALHDGHLSMVKKASQENDIVVVSIFINPTQFSKSEDFDKYPRDLKKDVTLAYNSGASVIFSPEAKAIYPEEYKTYVEVEEMSEVLCGASRQGHFKGVATVVTKLLNIVHPDKAYFGQKDAQQAVIIKQLVNDLNMDAEIVICPTIREKNGLAMSSRNVYLKEEEKKQSLMISKALAEAKQLLQYNHYTSQEIKMMMIERIAQTEGHIEYIEIVNADTLRKVDTFQETTLIAVAVKFGDTRLIDNIIISARRKAIS